MSLYIIITERNQNTMSHNIEAHNREHVVAKVKSRF